MSNNKKLNQEILNVNFFKRKKKKKQLNRY
jgi:hypothetical protein